MSKIKRICETRRQRKLRDQPPDGINHFSNSGGKSDISGINLNSKAVIGSQKRHKDYSARAKEKKIK